MSEAAVEVPPKVEETVVVAEPTVVEPIVEEKTEEKKESDASLILKQVEFYFSDGNLPKDKFLWKTQEANDGWVPIETIASFSRMKKFRPIELIVEALEKSTFLELSNNKELIKRVQPLLPATELEEIANKKTIYAKGFPLESTQEEIESFFEASEFAISQVRLRRYNKDFKGSVFVEFEKLEDMEEYLKKEIKYKNIDILTMSKSSYHELKGAESSFGQTDKERRGSFKGKGRGNFRGRGRGGRKNFNRNDRNSEKRGNDGDRDDSKRTKTE